VTFAPANVGRALIQGMTFAVKTRPVHGVTSNLSVTDLYRAQDLVTGTRLDDRGPVFTVGLGLDYTPPAWSRFDGFGVEITNEGPRGIVDPSAPAYDQPAAFTRVDAYAGFRIFAHAVLAVRGYNLGNDRYSEFGTYSLPSVPFYAFPMPGRSFAVELRTR
jgi:outer membrane receptor protein involved in Fe transport